MSTLSPVSIYDTTLRDGTQGEGISLSVASKLRLTEKMDQFRFDYIEGGWPGSNPRDMAYFQEARKLHLSHARLCAFGSTRRANTTVDVDKQVALLLEAETPVVTVVGKSWLLHVTEVLRTTAEENLAMIEETMAYLKSQGREVVYDAEHFFDGYKDDPAYALRTLEAALTGGADWLVLCDTNGGFLVPQLSEAVAAVHARFPDAKLGIHCHNDGGLGTALTLAAIEAGATMVQGTLNGYGERIGNANLTTILPNLSLKMQRPMACMDQLPKLRDLSLFADDMANLRPNIKEPFVGASAFAHKGGLHANAAEKVAHSYEHIRPELVGNRQRVLISDMSGRTSVMMKARELGMTVEEKSPEVKALLEEIKNLEHRGYEYEAADASFELLLDRFLEGRKAFFELVGYRVITERDNTSGDIVSEATVKLKVGGELRHTVAESTGPVGALDHALRRALESDYPCLRDMALKDYKVRILDTGLGADATIVVHVESSDGERLWGTVGAGANILEASWEALQDSVEYKLKRAGAVRVEERQ